MDMLTIINALRYAFGVTLWELYSAEIAFQDTAPALLGYKIIHEGVRPLFPDQAPEAYVELVQRCWSTSVSSRPSFEEIETILVGMRQAEDSVAGKLCFTPRVSLGNIIMISFRHQSMTFSSGCLLLSDSPSRGLQSGE